MSHTESRQTRDRLRNKKKLTFTIQEIETIDRNARAYGWEVGAGQDIKLVMDTTEGNPFMNMNWRGTSGVFNRQQ